MNTAVMYVSAQKPENLCFLRLQHSALWLNHIMHYLLRRSSSLVSLRLLKDEAVHARVEPVKTCCSSSDASNIKHLLETEAQGTDLD